MYQEREGSREGGGTTRAHRGGALPARAYLAEGLRHCREVSSARDTKSCPVVRPPNQPASRTQGRGHQAWDMNTYNQSLYTGKALHSGGTLRAAALIGSAPSQLPCSARRAPFAMSSVELPEVRCVTVDGQPDHWARLGVPRGADLAAVTKAFRK
eukprot:gene13145-biopygen2670